MSLLEEWRSKAYDGNADKASLERLWKEYFLVEKGFYEKILKKPDEVIEGSVKELATQFDISLTHMVGILDGINDSLTESNPIEEMTEDTTVKISLDKEKLYMNMVDAKADWLYTLPEWNEIFSSEKQKELYLKQKKSGTIVKEKKVGRNEPCPCGSGKKYKQCCGR